MAIDTESTRFLLWALRSGVPFGSSLSLGRQHLHVGNREMRLLLGRAEIDLDAFPRLRDAVAPRYAEPFWEALGGSRIESMDFSDFEQATIIQDLNAPVGEGLREQFDVVFDGGTLEHVFTLPVALRNALEMVRTGGHFITTTHANNYCGHGFYQFSPELFHRVLSGINGFRVKRMVAVEYGPRRRWFAVADPEAIGSRIPLINGWPVMLFVLAEKLAVTPATLQIPQQSDYAARWAEYERGTASGEAPPTQRSPGPVAGLKRFLLAQSPGLVRFLESLIYSRYRRAYSFRNRRAFTRLDKRHL